jgi:hypothetical protein
VHVAAQNGSLFLVAVVARLLPRHWDGRRLLRFLAGLAMLALAVTAPAVPAPAVPAPPLAAPVDASLSAIVAAPERAAVEESIAEPIHLPELPLRSAPATPIVAATLLVLAGVALRARAQRAPPAI